MRTSIALLLKAPEEFVCKHLLRKRATEEFLASEGDLERDAILQLARHVLCARARIHCEHDRDEFVSLFPPAPLFLSQYIKAYLQPAQ